MKILFKSLERRSSQNLQIPSCLLFSSSKKCAFDVFPGPGYFHQDTTFDIDCYPGPLPLLPMTKARHIPWTLSEEDKLSGWLAGNKHLSWEEKADKYCHEVGLDRGPDSLRGKQNQLLKGISTACQKSAERAIAGCSGPSSGLETQEPGLLRSPVALAAQTGRDTHQ